MEKSTSLYTVDKAAPCSHAYPPNTTGWPSQPAARRWVNSPVETQSPAFHHSNKCQQLWKNSSENCMYPLEHQKTLDEARFCPYQLKWPFMGGRVLKKQVWTSYSGTRESRGWKKDIPGTVSTSQLDSLTVSTFLRATDHHPSWPWRQPPHSDWSPNFAICLNLDCSGLRLWAEFRLPSLTRQKERAGRLCKQTRAPKEGAEEGTTKGLPTGNPDIGA